ncbi:MAG: hypothetical protein IRY99_09300 [Isosphaeraceae bacterium]|nr:hypothetical protein [Isosphaeraceae bacterium]
MNLRRVQALQAAAIIQAAGTLLGSPLPTVLDALADDPADVGRLRSLLEASRRQAVARYRL